MTLRDLMARREAIRTEMRSMHASAEGGALAEAAQTRWDALTADLSTLETQERRQATIDDLDRRATGQPLDGTGDPRFAELRNSVGLLDVIRAQLRDFRDLPGSARAREVSQELARRSGRPPANGLLYDMRATAPVLETRVLTSGKQGTLPNGAALVPLVQRADLFTDVLRSRLVIERAGATVISDVQGGDISFSRRVTTVQPAFVLENQPLPLSDGTFDQIKLAPKTAGVVSELSRNVAIQSSPSAEMLVRDDMAKTMAELIDRAALLGDGTGANPLGISAQAGRSTYTGAPAWDDVLTVLDALETASVEPNQWIIGPGVRRLLMQTGRSADQAEGFVMQNRGELAGLPVAQTALMPAGALLAGDFSQLIVAYWSAVEIVVNEFAQDAFMKGNLLVRAIVSMDTAVRHPAAFRLLSPAAAP